MLSEVEIVLEDDRISASYERDDGPVKVVRWGYSPWPGIFAVLYDVCAIERMFD